MSYAIHAKSLESLEWADLQELVDREAEESATLEFKGADIWSEREGKRGPQKAALPAIVAFANAYGGALVLGLREERGPPGLAAELQPVEGVAEKLEALQRAVADAIDPPLHALKWKAVMAPEGVGRGVIVARVPPSDVAPHGFGRPPEAYIRRSANSEPMTMRDMQNVFWDARARQERLSALRVVSRSRMEEVRTLRDAGALRYSYYNSDLMPATERGVFVRCSAIFQERLGVPIKKLLGVRLRTPGDFGLKCDGVFSSSCEMLATVGGYVGYLEYGSSLSLHADGVVDLVGFVPGGKMASSRGDEKAENVHEPRNFVAIFDTVAFAAWELAQAADRPDAPFEIDMDICADLPALASFGIGASGASPTLKKAELGPYLVASPEDLQTVFNAAQVAVFRSLGFDCAEPIRGMQDPSALVRLLDLTPSPQPL